MHSSPSPPCARFRPLSSRAPARPAEGDPGEAGTASASGRARTAVEARYGAEPGSREAETVITPNFRDLPERRRGRAELPRLGLSPGVALGDRGHGTCRGRRTPRRPHAAARPGRARAGYRRGDCDAPPPSRRTGPPRAGHRFRRAAHCDHLADVTALPEARQPPVALSPTPNSPIISAVNPTTDPTKSNTTEVSRSSTARSRPTADRE